MRFLLGRPGLSACAIAAVTVLAALFAVTMLRVDGDVARALKGTSEAFLANQQLEARFGAPSKDEVLFVRSGDFGSPEAFTALEDLVIDLQLYDGVSAVMSIFSLPDPAGEGVSFLARSDITALPPAERLAALEGASPFAPYLMSADRSAALLIVLPDLSVPVAQRLDEIAAAVAVAGADLTVRTVGLAALQRETSAALIADQLLISPLATFLCVAIALILFRSWRPAVICAFPSVVGLTWTFAAMAALGFPMDPLMAVVPTILIVLGIADSVHVIHCIMHHARAKEAGAAIAQGVRETLPAVIFAAATTGVAFLSLLVVGSPTVRNLAIVGPIGLILTTLAVYLVLPPAVYLLLKGPALAQTRAVRFRRMTDLAVGLLAHRGPVTVVALVLLGGLLVAQSYSVVGYRLMDHVPHGSDLRATLDEVQTVLPGSDQSFVLLEAADPEPGISEADKALLDRAGTALYGPGGGLVLPRDAEGIEHALVTRFQGADGTAFALPLINRLDMPSDQIVATAAATRAALDAEGIEGYTLTGYSLMSSVELPVVVEELRVAFYVAVGLVTLMAAALTRSVRIALISLVPNLIPILGVEAWLALTDRPLTIIGALAFTIAFGIAVDDTIHLMNRIRVARKPGARIDRQVMETALRATAAPVITTSIVLLAGFAVTMLSLLPSVGLFGQLTAAAMLVALLADLFLFPGLMLWDSKEGPET